MKKLSLETIFLVLAFTIFFYIAASNTFGHKITHDYPIGYLANDAYQDLNLAINIQEKGNYKYYPDFLGYTDIVGYYAPLLFVTPPIISSVSHIEIYDTLPYMVYLFAIIAIFTFYLLLARINKTIAILSLPLMAFVFFKSFYISFLWGQWGFLTGIVFLIGSIFSLNLLDKKLGWIIHSILMSAAIIVHPTEGFLAGLITVAFLIDNFIKTRSYKLLIPIIKSAILTFILTIYYIIIFLGTFVSVDGSKGKLIDLANPNLGYAWRPMGIETFGMIIMIMIFLGIIISLYLVAKKRLNALPIYSGIIILLYGYANHLGGILAGKAQQARFFWPVFLAVFFGITIYFILQFIKLKHIRLISLAIAAILLISFSWAYQTPNIAPTIATKEHWDMINWIDNNLPKGEKVLFFPSDVYYQKAVLHLPRTINYVIDVDSAVAAIQERKIKKVYNIGPTVEGTAYLPYRTSLFTFARHYNTSEHQIDQDLCEYEYFVFDIATQTPVFGQYNSIIINKMLENNTIDILYQNQIIVIAKNKKLDGECIKDETI